MSVIFDSHTHIYSHTQYSVAYALLESDNGEKVRRELTLAGPLPHRIPLLLLKERGGL